MPWWIPFAFELLKLLPALIRAVKEDPHPDNRESSKVVISKIKTATVGEPTDLKGIE